MAASLQTMVATSQGQQKEAAGALATLKAELTTEPRESSQQRGKLLQQVQEGLERLEAHMQAVLQRQAAADAGKVEALHQLAEVQGEVDAARAAAHDAACQRRTLRRALRNAQVSIGGGDVNAFEMRRGHACLPSLSLQPSAQLLG